MYTTKIIEKSIQRSAKRITVKVEFTKDNISHTEDFTFSLGTTIEQMKRTIGNYVSSLESSESIVDNILLGRLDTSLPPSISEQQEVERNQWFSDFGKLERANKLVSMGILTGNETPYVNLKTKVKNNFKASYLTDM